MPMYNLLKYSENHRKTTGTLWNYHRDEPNNPPANNYNANFLTNSESFEYKNSITGKISNANQENCENTKQENRKTEKNLKTVVQLKHSSNFWRSLDMYFIKCEVSLSLTWSEKCALTDIITQAANPNADPAIPAIIAPTNATFKITDTKFYAPVVTLSTKEYTKFFRIIKITI